MVPGWINVFGRFRIIPVFGSGEIISPAFFPNAGRGEEEALEGSARAVDSGPASG